MMDLLITLGYNALYIAIKDNQIVGYEQERLDRIKSSSRYPRDAIEQCLVHIKANGTDENTIYITH